MSFVAAQRLDRVANGFDACHPAVHVRALHRVAAIHTEDRDLLTMLALALGVRAALQRCRHLLEVVDGHEFPVVGLSGQRPKQLRVRRFTEGYHVQIESRLRDRLSSRDRVVRIPVGFAIAQQPDTAARALWTLPTHVEREPEGAGDVGSTAVLGATWQRSDPLSELRAPWFRGQADMESLVVESNDSNEIRSDPFSASGLLAAMCWPRIATIVRPPRF